VFRQRSGPTRRLPAAVSEYHPRARGNDAPAPTVRLPTLLSCFPSAITTYARLDDRGRRPSTSASAAVHPLSIRLTRGPLRRPRSAFRQESVRYLRGTLSATGSAARRHSAAGFSASLLPASQPAHASSSGNNRASRKIRLSADLLLSARTASRLPPLPLPPAPPPRAPIPPPPPPLSPPHPAIHGAAMLASPRYVCHRLLAHPFCFAELTLQHPVPVLNSTQQIAAPHFGDTPAKLSATVPVVGGDPSSLPARTPLFPR
jgi:hypothetical protein